MLSELQLDQLILSLLHQHCQEGQLEPQQQQHLPNLLLLLKRSSSPSPRMTARKFPFKPLQKSPLIWPIPATPLLSASLLQRPVTSLLDGLTPPVSLLLCQSQPDKSNIQTNKKRHYY
ncbi:hypothetical protein PCANC_17680 [Puccinia coronata f. sp. avenae]|uniref:Uncharacterized protein n=1 Tax=Puccinia coronata f. sp. avenae TaxID=200324 RepID=A0A2N5U975_9BASI|nr:hypothetical protein PCANC_17680 [Puccinia coronata f. sp. avenae]